MRVGADGQALLQAVHAETAPPDLWQLPAVETLRVRQVWIQNFMTVDQQVVWRENDNIPPSGRYITSPYDPDAHYTTKRSLAWTGYKVHLTETCEADCPNLITHVETTAATVADDAVTATIHADLAQQNLLPAQHIADTGYVNSKLFVDSHRQFGIDLIGPTRGDHHWQAQNNTGFAAAEFGIDWATH